MVRAGLKTMIRQAPGRVDDHPAGGARTSSSATSARYSRKIREWILTPRLEKALTKDQILGLYVNQIYFGHNRYGVEEAALFYFGKHAKDLERTARRRCSPAPCRARTASTRSRTWCGRRSGSATCSTRWRRTASSTEKLVARELEAARCRSRPGRRRRWAPTTPRRSAGCSSPATARRRCWHRRLRVRDRDGPEAPDVRRRRRCATGSRLLDHRMGYARPGRHARREAVRAARAADRQAHRRGGQAQAATRRSSPTSPGSPSSPKRRAPTPPRARGAEERPAEQAEDEAAALGGRGRWPDGLAQAARGGHPPRRVRHRGRRRQALGHGGPGRAAPRALVLHARLGPPARRRQVDRAAEEALRGGEAGRAGAGEESPGSPPRPRRSRPRSTRCPRCRAALIVDRPRDPARARDGRRLRLPPLGVQPRHPGASGSRARRSSRSSTPRRSTASSYTPLSMVNDAPEADPRSRRPARSGSRRTTSGRLRGADDPARGAHQVEEHRLGAADRGAHPAGGDRLRAPRRHPLGDARQPHPRARHRRGLDARDRQRLRHARTRSGGSPSRSSSSRCTDADGTVLEEHQAAFEETLPPAVAYLATSLMRSVVEEGTATAVKELNRPAAGKTGTASASTATPGSAATPRTSSPPRGSASTTTRASAAARPAAGPRCRSGSASCSAAQEGRPVRDFEVPPGVTMVRIDPVTGLLAGSSVPGRMEPFLDGTAADRRGAASRPGAPERLLHRDGRKARLVSAPRAGARRPLSLVRGARRDDARLDRGRRSARGRARGALRAARREARPRAGPDRGLGRRPGRRAPPRGADARRSRASPSAAPRPRRSTPPTRSRRSGSRGRPGRARSRGSRSRSRAACSTRAETCSAPG